MLAERGLRPTAPPTQVRTWNLSSLWRVPVEGQTVWLKVVPHFFAHEGTLLARMAGARVPTMLSHDGGRMLLAEIAGKDLYAPELPLLREMVSLLVDLQRLWGDRVAELLALGLPDWRASALGAAIANVVDRTCDEIPAENRVALAELVCGLPSRFDDVAACGLQDSLVHGDFHPGNFRGDERTVTLLDWGDSAWGILCWTNLPFWIRFRAAPSARCRRTGCSNGVKRFPVPTLRALRPCLPRSLPRDRRLFIVAFSTTSSFRSSPTTGPIRRSG